MDDLDIIKEFVIESTENLSRLDRDMVELEKQPKDGVLLASIFRTIHTIKGTCGFLGFHVLERITHHAENILSQVRNGDRDLTPDLVSIILETVDCVKTELTSIEATSRESGADYADLLARQQEVVSAAPKKAPAVAEPEKTPEATVPEPEQLAATQSVATEVETSASQKNSSVADSTIRVDVGLLDKLMNLVGELVLSRNQILQFTARHDDASLNATSQRLNLITTELQESVMKTRMQPIGMVWNKLPRVVRDLATSCGKQIALEMDGAETELDKTILEAIKDPLTHIVRNSCDHGIEMPEVRARNGKSAQGKLMLRAFHEGGNVNIEISDDGGGINPEKVKQSALQKGLLRPEQVVQMNDRELINLVFLPGFSTAQKVSSISGRGVGMDVVKTNIEKIGGVVDLMSKPGQGATVKIRIPLTLAIIPGLIVTAGSERFVIPQVSLLELVRLEGDARRQIEYINGSPVYRRRGHLLPLASLNDTLKLPRLPESDDQVVNIVVLQADERQFGLVVDSINDTQEIVVKPLGKQLKGLSWFAGATIMGDGKIALILDVLGIAKLSGVVAESRSAATAEIELSEESVSTEKETLLLFRAGTFQRLAVPLSIVARLEEIPIEKIEQAAGRKVVQYRDQILPLVVLADQLDGMSSATDQENVQVIVFSDGDKRIGLLVDEIVDIVESTVAVRKASTRPGLLGSAVIGEKVTDFLDLPAVIRGAEDDWFQGSATSSKDATVLVMEGSRFSRGVLKNYLEIAGYRVVEAESASDAMELLERRPVHVIVAGIDSAGGGAAIDLLQSVRQQPGLQHLPVLALSNSTSPVVGESVLRSGFSDYVHKFDRMMMLQSVENLAKALRESESRLAAAALAGVEK